MKQSEITVLAMHHPVKFVHDFQSPTTGKSVKQGSLAIIVGYVPDTGIAGYHKSKTPVVLLDGPQELPFSVHEDFVELV